MATLITAGVGGDLPSVEGLDLLLGMTESEEVAEDPEMTALREVLGVPRAQR